jgi:hypothetical protein
MKKTQRMAAPANTQDNVCPIVGDFLTFDLDALEKASNRTMASLNENELKSVLALIAYTACEQRVSQDVVSSVVETRFGAESVSDIHSHDYEEVVRFLVDMNVDQEFYIGNEKKAIN